MPRDLIGVTAEPSGAPVASQGTREFAAPKTPFVIFYRVTPDAVEVLRVLRGSRNLLPEI